MEVRYIVFTPDEMRGALATLVQKQGLAASVADVGEVEIVGPNDAPAAMVRIRTSTAAAPTKLTTDHILAALLLYCIDRHIPIPKNATKRLEMSINGLTMIVTSDQSQGSPLLASNQVTYGEMANRATQKITAIEEELARVTARAVYAESLVADAEERAKKAEAARAKSSAALVSVVLAPGIRGHIGRWLVNFRHRSLNDYG